MTLRIWQVLMVCIPMLYVTSTVTTIQHPPTMIKQPPHEQLYQVAQNQDEHDKPFVLECEASGNPEPVYKWIKNGQPFDYVSYNNHISQQPRRGTLVFEKPDDDDEGLYQCFAENIHGISVSNSVFLRKSELNTFPDIGKKIIGVKEGEPLTLQCNPPTGYPKPSIIWLLMSNNGALRAINSSRLTVDPEGNLHFSNVSRKDSLKYQHYICSASSIFRNEYKLGNRISLDIQSTGESDQSSYGPTRQYTSPSIIVGLLGQAVTLSCIYGGTPMPQIVWRKKGGSLSSPRYQYKQYGRTLKISQVTYDDEATYECTASNGNGSPDSHAMNVTVQAAPYWVESPNNTNAAEGEFVTFKCHANGIPEPKLQWFVNGKLIDKAISNPRRKVQGNILHIENLVKLDTAVYQCNASNIHGYVFRDFYLNVLALPPTITEPPEPLVKAVVSSTVILRCKVFGAPHPDVKWIKVGQELTGGRYQVIDDGNLEIKNVSLTDQGEYTCYAVNKFGKAKEHGRLEVKDKTKIIQPPENSEVAEGKSATFRCNVKADPTLTLQIIWLFNDQPIDFDQEPRIVKMFDNSLIITRTTELDSGIYVCLAKTELDSDNTTATLTVRDMPNPPKIIGIKCNGLSAILEWQPIENRRAPILSYNIQYNTSFTSDSWINGFENIPASDTQLTLSLSPWANYTFRIIAKSKIGSSLPSAPSDKCETLTDVPYKNPDKVEGYGTEPNNLIISWSPMPPIDHNAPGFYYRVYWKHNDFIDAKWEYKEITNWKQNQYILYNQPTFKPYQIKVTANNRMGQSNIIPAEIIGYSGEDVPEEAPKNFRLVYIKDARSAQLVWNHVPKHSVRGHFKGYKIQAWTPEEDEEYMREQIVSSEKNESLINILRPNSNNKVVIFVFNGRYNGPQSEVIQFYTPEGTPGPVESFDAIPLGVSAFYLIWKRPLEPNGNLTGYRIYYEEVHGTPLDPKIEHNESFKYIIPIETKAKLAGLKPNTKYRITIYATTTVGQGIPYSIELKTNKESDVPPDAPGFTWHNLPDEEGKAGVLVTWLPAIEGRPGSHFYVQYRRKRESQWESTPPEEIKDTTVVQGLELGTLYEMRVVSVDGTYHIPSKIEEIDTGDLKHELPLESSSNLDSLTEKNINESQEIDTDANILKLPENKTEINEALMMICINALKNNSIITPNQAIGINVAVKLEKMNFTQRLYAEQLITIILFKGLTGRLTAETDIVEIS